MAGWFETYRGVIFPWNCDFYGHMNVRWYAHHFDDAGFHLWTMAGIPQTAMRDRGVFSVVATTKTDFVHEMRVGELLVVKSAFVHVGNKSLRHVQRMYNADTGTLCAMQDTVEVFFDPNARKSMPMPDFVRTTVLPHLVAADSEP